MPDLTIQNLSTTFLHDISFSVQAGGCAVISGESGSGKSLLLRAVADLDPHEGSVRLGDMDASQCPPHEWRRRVALLPAESRWWRDMVGEHFRIKNPLFLEQLGFETDVMSWPVSRLSSGERQRLALVLLLEMRPDALLLDEPAANLDSMNAERIEKVVAEYARDRSAPVIWVTHDMQQASRLADQYFVMDNGMLDTSDKAFV